ncbi:MAG: D-alanyl-D-alanine carboxypeptidase [Acidimicrobiaceae bacterium]|nr:D-alanyl-D-alanine carboxypeptidase [Acidimicrobiaceae bacterium]
MPRNDNWLPSSRRSIGGYSSRRGSSGASLRRFRGLVILVVLLLVIISAIQLIRPVPMPTLSQSMRLATTVGGPAVSLPYPTNGESEVVVPQVGVLGQSGGSQPVQIASVAKMMTAYIIIKDHPLAIGASGPSITITQADYQSYLQQSAAVDSVMAVAPGETMSEYQMLEGLLIPSADNIATALARWDAGSTTAFVAKMNAMAKKLGMTATHYTDPSGLDPRTVSNTKDQMKLAQLLEQNPTLSQIVSYPQATLPVAGVVYNVDYDLGSDGIAGIKTGSTPSGGSFVFYSRANIQNQSTGIFGAVLFQQSGQPLITALDVAKALAKAAPGQVRYFKVISAGAVVGTLTPPGGGAINVYATKSVYAFGWAGLNESIAVSPTLKTHTVASGAKVAEITVKVGEQVFKEPAVVNSPVVKASLKWRLTRL